MNFRMDLEIPAPPDSIWPIFFDVARIASLIPGCEQVEEREPLALYSAVMKQKIGPFRMEAPAEVRVEEMQAPSRLKARARGRDKFTGTTMDVELDVQLEAAGAGPQLVVDAALTVAGRLASLGYPVVKKKAEEMFTEFEKRLRAELGVPDAAAAL
jgi:carbon monoxide dehydrogenase subunit G